MDPYLAGAVIGAGTTGGNIITGIDKPCNTVRAMALGTLGGVLGGGFGGVVGDAFVPEFAQLGTVIGSTAGSQAWEAVTVFVDFWKGF